MARITLSRHWKFRQLARAVGSPPLARGLLELLWEAAYEAANDYLGSPADIADAAGWTDDPLDLVALLLDAELLDERAPGAYVVHDLWVHAPSYVRLRWRRAHPGQTPPWIAERVDQSSDPVDRRSRSYAREVQEQVQELEQEREQRRGRGASSLNIPNVRVLVRLAYELHQRYETEADLADALKTLAAHYRVPYDGPSIGRALELLAHARAPLWITPQPQPRRRTG